MDHGQRMRLAHGELPEGQRTVAEHDLLLPFTAAAMSRQSLGEPHDPCPLFRRIRNGTPAIQPDRARGRFGVDPGIDQQRRPPPVAERPTPCRQCTATFLPFVNSSSSRRTSSTAAGDGRRHPRSVTGNAMNSIPFARHNAASAAQVKFCNLLDPLALKRPRRSRPTARRVPRPPTSRRRAAAAGWPADRATALDPIRDRFHPCAFAPRPLRGRG